MRRLFLSALLPLTVAAAAYAQDGAPARDIDYAILLSVSEPVAFDGSAYAPRAHESATARRRRAQATSAARRPAVPDFTVESETPALSRAIQTATALRLRGETVAAAEAYAHVLTLSRKPVHAFFHAEVARANGDHLLADFLRDAYATARACDGQLAAAGAEAEAGHRDIRVAGVVTDARTGARLEGVEVRVLDPLAYREHAVQTDENGLFIVDGVSRRAHLRIVSAAPGYGAGDDALYVDPAHVAHAPMIGMRVYLQPDGAGARLN